jgi:glycerate 2-kinase
MHILIAPNAFKHSCTATEAALAIQSGLLQSKLDCQCTCFPVGDGGDGTAELIISACGGRQVYATVTGPLGEPVNASFGLVDNDTTAVIEMANASGIRLLRSAELNPLRALSYGTGQQIKQALDLGVQKIIIGMGGSATVDGGCGMLAALGVRFLDAAGQQLEELPGSLVNLAAVDITALDKRVYKTKVVVLCDVANKLLGEQGAAAVFGPQKGAGPAAVAQLDAGLAAFSALALQAKGKNMAAVQHGGTAGGAAAGLFAFLDAELVNGIDHFLSITGFEAVLEKATLVITGEGSIDEQTLEGKGPYGVARQAKARGLPVIGLAGKIPGVVNAALQEYFDVLLPIGHQPVDIKLALAATEKDLERTAFTLGKLLSI